MWKINFDNRRNEPDFITHQQVSTFAPCLVMTLCAFCLGKNLLTQPSTFLSTKVLKTMKVTRAKQVIIKTKLSLFH